MTRPPRKGCSSFDLTSRRTIRRDETQKKVKEAALTLPSLFLQYLSKLESLTPLSSLESLPRWLRKQSGMPGSSAITRLPQTRTNNSNILGVVVLQRATQFCTSINEHLLVIVVTLDLYIHHYPKIRFAINVPHVYT